MNKDTSEAEKQRAAQHWSKVYEQAGEGPSGTFWLELPAMQGYINRMVSGDPTVNWVRYTREKYLQSRLPVENCLSLGCGEGRLERSLAELGIFRHCDAYDFAEGSIAIARKKAKDLNIETISYHVADINRLTLTPATYDLVWIDSALHHFEALEAVCEQVALSLKPGGYLILNEYIGAKRFQFSERQKEITNACMALLPTRYRYIVEPPAPAGEPQTGENVGRLASRLLDKIKDGTLIETVGRKVNARIAHSKGERIEKREVEFPSARDVIAADPTEAIRSDEIVPVVEQFFTILEKKDWGGNILQFLLSSIAGNFREEDEVAQSLLQLLTTIEATLIQCGELDSDFAYIIAEPRRQRP